MKPVYAKGFLFGLMVFLLVVFFVPQDAFSQTDTTEGFDSGSLPSAFPPTNWTNPGADTTKWYRSDDAHIAPSGLDPGYGVSGHSAVFPSNKLPFSVGASLNWNRNFSNYVTVQLQFYYKNPDGDDYLIVNVNGTAKYNNSSSPIATDWTLIEPINLNTYAGNSSVTIEFQANSNFDNGGSNLGIDNISLSTTPLPVQLASFSASANRAATELRWTTATEVNNYGFEVERRQIGVGSMQTSSWQNVGFVVGAGTSTSPREYTFTDRNVTYGRYAYRIKQIDNDGTFEYFGSAEVEVALAAKRFELEANYPNPFNPSTTIGFTLAEDGQTRLRVFNVMGQEVATLFDDAAEAGRMYQVKFDASHLPSGVYFARLESAKQQTMRKMVLLK